MGLFEVDELWLGEIVGQVHPRAILLGNLFRDQLDRYGELEHIAEHWAHTLAAGAGAAREARAQRGRPDSSPTSAANAPTRCISASRTTRWRCRGMAHAADAKHCRRCGAPYVFDAIYLGHLGHYHCTVCGAQRPQPDVIAKDINLMGVRSASFTLCTPRGEAQVQLALPGLYNVYNALAAAALAHALGLALPAIVAGLQQTQAAFGRAESVMVGAPAHPRELRILLVKNPAGANEVLRTLALEPGSHDVLGVLNDNIADGRDVSWIWDADFELLAGRCAPRDLRRHARRGAGGAAEVCRHRPGLHRVREDLAAALDQATADRPGGAGAEAASPPSSPCPPTPRCSRCASCWCPRGGAQRVV